MATITARSEGDAGQESAAREATLTHIPAQHLLRVRLGSRTYLSRDTGPDAQQVLVDDAERRVWTAPPASSALADRIELTRLDPVVVLTRTGATQDIATRPDNREGHTQLQITQDQRHLECVVDDTTRLPTTCRSWDERHTSAVTATTFTWAVASPSEIQAAARIAAPGSYTWTKLS